MAMLQPVELDAATSRAHSQPLARAHSQRIPRSSGSPHVSSEPLSLLHRPPQLQAPSRPLPRQRSQSILRPQAARPTHRSYEDVVARIELRRQPLARRVTKRAIDVIGSTLGLIALSPLLVVIALAVVVSSRGPVLFVQERCGVGGRRFRFFKFRTMVKDAEARKHSLAHLNEMSGPVFKIRRDPRITALGGVLRKLSLDELPQLWNVLRGEMSLVGPRPPTPDEVECYTDRHVQRLSVMAGITGLWQVSGRNEIAEFERWVELDLQYARTCSLWTDLRILLKTVIVVARVRGAH